MKNKPAEPKDSDASRNYVHRFQHHNRVLESSYIVTLENYYNKKYGQIVSPIAILKTCAVVSSQFKDNVRLWILNVAPSGQLKSHTSDEQENIFSKDRLIYAGSDFTIHSIEREFHGNLDKKCVLVNDFALLLSSKAERTRQRLVNALAELYSEGVYIYSDFQKTLTIKGKFSLIANITPHMLNRNRNDLLGNTFLDRCLTVYYKLTNKEMSEGNLQREERNKLKIGKFKQKLHEKDITISKEDIVRFDEYAKRWRVLGGYATTSRLFDMIKSAAIAYAILLDHKSIGEDEYSFLNVIEHYVRSPFEPSKTQIIQLADQGRSIKDICLIMNQDYKTFRPYVSRVLKEARLRGVLE
ncbi:hypothetical protein KEJ47_08995 [Candidatus Bathyarchaeota archaeon]|nr:hypothetical protein [Candidatus Bathyarchaeota archaeon]